MTRGADLHWLPQIDDWRTRLRVLAAGGGGAAPWPEVVALAGGRLDFVATNALDAVARKALGGDPPPDLVLPRVRLALLGSSTLTHLHAAIRVAGFRRGMWIETYECAYGQYFQALIDPASPLHAFAPTHVLLALDARHLTQGVEAALSQAEADAAIGGRIGHVRTCWRLAKEGLGASVIHQTALNVFPDLLGNNEHRLASSPGRAVVRLNAALRALSDDEGVDMLALDAAVQRDGLRAWHDPALWHRSKQEISPAAAPLHGDLVGRLIAARQGRSYKCLVLDLDNTLWGGVIGDDGLGGIVLGQGSALGEGFLAVQAYAKALSRRGVILAVSSKNDHATAMQPFEVHPEMALRAQDIAVFRANWEDKVGNIRAIAETLNIGLDSLVFLDDNPFERELVRARLPMVAVPEVPDDPALVPQALADAGYFEGLVVTREDAGRTLQYQANIARRDDQAAAADLTTYLRDLGMRLIWAPFDEAGLPRIVQLINKTNQFNLTTRRRDETAVRGVMGDERAFGLQLRLIDRFGDNGVIAIVIGRMREPSDVIIDTWLMSCRVLGRGVESATLDLVVEQARRLGGRRLVGEYLPTARNGLVKDHYVRLGFEPLDARPGGAALAVLDLEGFASIAADIIIERAAP